MERSLTGQLAVWKDNPRKKPLILKGVRQCGKTWLLREFGEKHYDDTAYFSFEGNAPLCALFEGDLDPRRIITELGVHRQKSIEPGKTLIIFDEIQFCGRALSSLKYFCEDAPEYHIACAGSLLGLALSGPLSFPVGKVDFLTLRPLSFYEFLLANGETLLCEHLEQFPLGEPAPELLAAALEGHLKTYYMTGGMPEAVANWIAHHDIEQLEAVHRKILDSYELDFAKHAPAGEFPRLRGIWHSIPAQLAKENSKFIFSQVKKGRRAKDLEDALEWLLAAGLVFRVAKVEKPFMPLSSYADSSFFKLYMADVGLLRTMAALPAEAIFERIDIYKEFKGALTENYVLTELVNLYNETPFFWRSNNTAEVDFVIQQKLDIVPVEVKSERNTKAKSLAEYRKKYEPEKAVKTSLSSAGNVVFDEKKGAVLNVPLYMLWKLKALLDAMNGLDRPALWSNPVTGNKV